MSMVTKVTQHDDYTEIVAIRKDGTEYVPTQEEQERIMASLAVRPQDSDVTLALRRRISASEASMAEQRRAVVAGQTLKISAERTFRKSLMRTTIRVVSRRKPPLRGLVRFADLFGLETRKAIKAMAGDYHVEIRRLRRERRWAMARWNAVLAWGYAGWFVLRSPVDKLTQYATKAWRGS